MNVHKNAENAMNHHTDSNLNDILPRLEDICKKIKKERQLFRDHLLPQVTVSMGVAEVPTHGSTSEAIIRADDDALYHAKKNGRDRIDIYDNNICGSSSSI